MRLWFVNPKIMCRNHLLGEHLESHMFFGAIKRKIKLDGYIKNGLFFYDRLKSRHNEIAKEMLRRGYKHKTPLNFKNKFKIKSNINKEKSLKELLKRCKECRKNLK